MRTRLTSATEFNLRRRYGVAIKPFMRGKAGAKSNPMVGSNKDTMNFFDGVSDEMLDRAIDEQHGDGWEPENTGPYPSFSQWLMGAAAQPLSELKVPGRNEHRDAKQAEQISSCTVDYEL